MKVFNLTDVETPKLKQHGMLNQSFAVGDKMISPGASEDIDDATFARVQPELQKLTEIGALSCDAAPDTYKSAKTSAEPAAPAAPQPSGGSDEPSAPPAGSGKRGSGK